MNAQEALNLVVVAGVILSGIGYATGQFLAQRRRARSDALDVALSEIEALHVRTNRQDGEIAGLNTEMTKLRAENESFRSLLTGGAFLAEQIRTLVADEVEKGARLVINAIREGSP